MRSGALQVEKAAPKPSVLKSPLSSPGVLPGTQVREVMDIRLAADYLAISTDSLYRYASDGVVPAFRLGNRWRFKKSRLDQWMDEQSDGKPVRPRMKKPVSSQR